MLSSHLTPLLSLTEQEIIDGSVAATLIVDRSVSSTQLMFEFTADLLELVERGLV